MKQAHFQIAKLTFGKNGPYDLSCGPECIGIKGVSGIGKTLFLRALCDLDPHGGEVILNGRKLSEFTGPQWRSQVGMVPAESRWWHSRIRDHFPIQMERDQIVEMVNTLGFKPEVLNWQPSRLSTGEKQRLSLARTLAREPAVLLLDEMGSGLDSANLQTVEQIVLEYQKLKQVTVIWVSHDDDQLHRVCDRSFTLLVDKLIPVEETSSLQNKGQ
ncbi:MAG: ATP-binding cassette domain-containing protein [Desulfobulbaceae bacterium]|nr:MAG: ATP-binding cassette domain-containing protein [Desulfobulbaceae bacterium]